MLKQETKMNKSKSNMIEKTTVLALAVAMLTSVVVFPASVSAATTKKTTIPKSFASKDACLVKLKTYKLASLKTYGDKRIATRDKALESKPEKIEKEYKKYEKAEPLARLTVSGANAVEQAATGKVSQPDVPIASRKSSLLKEVKDTKNMLDAKKADLSKAKTSETASEAICSVMFDLRVFSYLDKKVNAQLKVDTARLKIAQNNARQKAVKKTYEKHKNNKDFAKKSKKIKAKIEALPDSQESINKLNDLQSRLDAISVEALNTDNATSKAELNKIVAEAKVSSKNAVSEGKTINSLYKSLKRIIASKNAPGNTVNEDNAKGTIEGPIYTDPGTIH